VDQGLVAIVSSRLLLATTAGVPRRVRLQRSAAPISLAATQTSCGRRASIALVVAAVCCLLRRKEFRFADAVQAVKGILLDIDVLADHLGGDAGVTQSNARHKPSGRRYSLCSRLVAE
jgi:hypothetical protein